MCGSSRCMTRGVRFYTCFVSIYVEDHGVVWREFGGNVTIHCRVDASHIEFLNVERGLSKDVVLVKENNKTKNTIDENFDGRLELSGTFPNLDIIITNLSSKDTGPYWCMYSTFLQHTGKMFDFKGRGSLLLVVKGESSLFIQKSTSSSSLVAT